jgi:hypothetical protein
MKENRRYAVDKRAALDLLRYACNHSQSQDPDHVKAMLKAMFLRGSAFNGKSRKENEEAAQEFVNQVIELTGYDRL